MVEYREINWDKYPRKAHFAYFQSLQNPYAGVTVPVDITAFLASVHRRGLPFFHCFLYAVTRAANAVPELRQRILEGRIVEFPSCPASYTVALPDSSYCYCRLEADRPLEDFLPYAKDRVD